MSRSSTFLYNSTASAVLQIFTVIAGFIIPRIMLTVYGSEINGLVTSIMQFVGYFKLVEAGLATSSVYALYKPLAEKDTKGVNAIISASRNLYNKTGYIFVSLVIGLALIYPAFIRSTSATIIEVGVLIIVLGCAGALEFFTMSKYRVLLTADQKLYVISFASICAIILNTTIIAVLASYKVNIVVLKAVALSAVFLRSVILWAYVKKYYCNLDYFAAPNNYALKSRWDALYLQLLGSVHSAAPVIIATIFTSLMVVSVYSIYQVVMGGITSLLSIAVSGLFASFGDIIARKEQNVLQKAYQEFELIYYMLISWVYSCAFIMIMPFIKLYTRGVSDINYNLPIIGALFVVNGLLYNIKTPQGMLVISAGLFKETRLQNTIQAAIAVFFGVIFVQFWGLAGILAGSILSNLYRDIDLLFFIPHKITKLKVRNTFFRICRIFICFGIVVIPLQYFTLDVANYLDWLKYAIIISIYALIVVIVVNIICDRKTCISAIRRLSVVISR